MTRVLLIDDDEMVRNTLMEMLTDLGCFVVEAEDGQRGVALVQSEKPDLVITDILMPNKEGTETIQEIRSANPDLPIIAISGGGLSGDLTFLDYAERVGANRILQKPIDLYELEVCLRVLTGAETDAAASAANM